MRILLIEDHAACAEGFLCLMETYLPEANVVHCTTLADAARSVEFDGPFAVIVLDLSLPDASGTEGLSRLRGLVRETTDTPIIVYTAYPHFEQACLDLGAGAFCVKANINGADLAALIQRICD